MTKVEQSQHDLIESYRNLVESLVLEIEALASSQSFEGFEGGFHEGTDISVADFVCEASPESAAVMEKLVTLYCIKNGYHFHDH